MVKKMFVLVGAIYSHDTNKNRKEYTIDVDAHKDELIEVSVIKEGRLNSYFMTPEGFGTPHMMKLERFQLGLDERDRNYYVYSPCHYIFESKLQYHICKLASTLCDMKFEIYSAISDMDETYPLRKDCDYGEEFYIRAQASSIVRLRKLQKQLQTHYREYMREKRNPS